MRPFAILAALILALPAAAQPRIAATLVAESRAALSVPHQGSFSPDGKLLYLTDMGNSRIAVLEAMTLNLVGYFGEKELSNPHDATFDAKGRLLVADTGNGMVPIYEVRGAVARRVGLLEGLVAPEGVAVGPDGRVYVTNTGAGSVSVFRDGRLERTVGRRGSGAGEFVRPHDIAVSPKGEVVVVDSGNARLQVFDLDMKHRASTPAALGLNEPKYLDFDGEAIWIGDEYNHRILKVDAAHRPLGQLGTTGTSGRSASLFLKPEAVLVRAPHVWVIDTYNNRVVLLRLGK